MRKTVLLAPLALALAGIAGLSGLMAPSPATAAAPKPDKVYYDLYDAVIGGVDLELVSRKGAGEVFDAFTRNEPAFARQTAGKPGVRDRFIDICMPFFRVWMPRSLAISRERSVAAIAPVLTLEEARQIGRFYASPLGRKIARVAAGNLTFASQLDSQMQGGEFDDEYAKADDEGTLVDKSTRQLRQALTPAEIREFNAFMQTPAFKKISAMNRALATVVQPTPEEISTPEEREAFVDAIRQFMANLD